MGLCSYQYNINASTISDILLSCSDGGKYCLTGGTDKSVRLWNPTRVDPACHSQNVISGDGSRRDLLNALPIQVYREGVTHEVAALAVSADTETNGGKSGSKGSASTVSSFVAACQQSVIWVDLITQQIKGKWSHDDPTHGRINDVAISRETVVSASYDSTVRIWDCRAKGQYRPVQILREAKDSVTAVQVGYDAIEERYIRSASVDGCFRTYDLRMGQLSQDDMQSPITSVAMARENMVALNCLDGAIRLVDTESGTLIRTLSGHHKAGKYGLPTSVTAHKEALVTGSEDGFVYFYDVAHGSVLQRIPGDSTGVEERPTAAIAAHPSDSSVAIVARHREDPVVWGGWAMFDAINPEK